MSNILKVLYAGSVLLWLVGSSVWAQPQWARIDGTQDESQEDLRVSVKQKRGFLDGWLSLFDYSDSEDDDSPEETYLICRNCTVVLQQNGAADGSQTPGGAQTMAAAPPAAPAAPPQPAAPMAQPMAPPAVPPPQPAAPMAPATTAPTAPAAPADNPAAAETPSGDAAAPAVAEAPAEAPEDGA